uniref:NADH-ubiquinone oxidoreductase chain 1 n=1 Tax=Diaphanes pectinealis TaxID=370597 RepID=A0A5C0PX68_9COLE|nr:NADH dehydrogenase subunit 1 [Diaphanes pectinealis]QEJ81668.1 NADH dehydrogenase subunit 1 [Diaphanes pectinealis]
MIIFLNFIVLIISVLIGLAFLTLFERKVLGYIQIRKGPNKVGFTGIIQPLSDAVKLFSKEHITLIMSNYFMYYLSPIFSLLFSLLLWVCLPIFTGFMNFSFSFLFFMCISSLSVYTIMVAGWSSNSNYSMLGSLRCVAQTISYEVSLFMILLSFLLLISSLSVFDMVIYQVNIWFFFICIPLCMIWFVSSLAETNRTPFDFSEGESELVSGFNVEYSAGGFAMIFMAEYSSILFMSSLFVFIFMGSLYLSFIYFIMVLLISFFFIWVRGTLPRFRYDKLMYLTWKGFLPISLNFLYFFIGLKFFIYILMM